MFVKHLHMTRCTIKDQKCLSNIHGHMMVHHQGPEMFVKHFMVLDGACTMFVKHSTVKDVKAHVQCLSNIHTYDGALSMDHECLTNISGP